MTLAYTESLDAKLTSKILISADWSNQLVQFVNFHCLF